jgi:hypothetical protein
VPCKQRTALALLITTIHLLYTATAATAAAAAYASSSSHYTQGAKARTSDWVHWQMCGAKFLMPEWKRIMGEISVVSNPSYSYTCKSPL